MAQNYDWESLVPAPVAHYIKEHHLDERFRKEFGLETLATMLANDYQSTEPAEAEAAHAREL